MAKATKEFQVLINLKSSDGGIINIEDKAKKHNHKLYGYHFMFDKDMVDFSKGGDGSDQNPLEYQDVYVTRDFKYIAFNNKIDS